MEEKHKDQPFFQDSNAEDVFEKLFKENYEYLCKVVYKYIGDVDASRDILQEVFSKQNTGLPFGTGGAK